MEISTDKEEVRDERHELEDTQQDESDEDRRRTHRILLHTF